MVKAGVYILMFVCCISDKVVAITVLVGIVIGMHVLMYMYTRESYTFLRTRSCTQVCGGGNFDHHNNDDPMACAETKPCIQHYGRTQRKPRTR